MTGHLHEKLQDMVIGLNVEEIVSAWDGASDTDSQVDVASIIGASLGVAGTAVGAFPGGAAAGAAIGALAGIFGTAEAAAGGGGGGGGGSPTRELKHLVQRFFRENNELLGRTLRDVFGGYNGHPGRIPLHNSVSLDDGHDSEGDDDKRKKWHIGKVSKFFSHGKWLFRDVDPHAEHFVRHTRKTLRQALGIFAMNNKYTNDPSGEGYAVVINTDVDKADCRQQDNMARWTRGHCFNLFWFNHYSDSTGEWNGYWDVGDEWAHTFKHYDLGPKKYYNNVWDCATSHAKCHHGNHTVKWHNWNGKGTPLCLFHTRLVWGSYDASTGKMSDVKHPCDHQHSGNLEHDPADDDEEGFLDSPDQQYPDYDEDLEIDAGAFMRTARQGFLNNDESGLLDHDEEDYADDEKEDWRPEL